MLRMLPVILLVIETDGTTDDSQSTDSAVYNILSSLDISSEVSKVFTSLWATPEVKVGHKLKIISPGVFLSRP